MDYKQQVRRASGGDVKAFVDLTRQFQHMAFGAALALVNDFHQAEDVVQEAFVAAWSALPSLADPAAFPGWLHDVLVTSAAHMRRAEMMLERDRKALADTVVVVVIMPLQNRTGTTRSIGRSRAAPHKVAMRPKDCRGSPFSTVKAGRTPNPTALVGPASRRPTWR